MTHLRIWPCPCGSRQIFRHFEFPSKHTFRSCNYRFCPNRTRKATQHLWTHAIKIPQAEFEESVLFRRNWLPNLVGGANFTKNATNRKHNVLSTPNWKQMSRVVQSMHNQKHFHFHQQGAPQTQRMYMFLKNIYIFRNRIHSLQLRCPLLVTMKMLLVTYCLNHPQHLFQIWGWWDIVFGICDIFHKRGPSL